MNNGVSTTGPVTSGKINGSNGTNIAAASSSRLSGLMRSSPVEKSLVETSLAPTRVSTSERRPSTSPPQTALPSLLGGLPSPNGSLQEKLAETMMRSMDHQSALFPHAQVNIITRNFFFIMAIFSKVPIFKKNSMLLWLPPLGAIYLSWCPASTTPSWWTPCSDFRLLVWFPVDPPIRLSLTQEASFPWTCQTTTTTTIIVTMKTTTKRNFPSNRQALRICGWKRKNIKRHWVSTMSKKNVISSVKRNGGKMECSARIYS